MKKHAIARIIAFSALAVCGCASFTVPKDYVPDSKVVFLREKLEYGPIHYSPMEADPYTFAPDASRLDLDHPSFLMLTSLEPLLKPDFAADSRLYREIEGHLLAVRDSTSFASLRASLDAADIIAPPPLPASRGDKTKDYSNATEYEYPDVPGARITIFATGDYKIDFPDKGSFTYGKDGSYARTEGSGAIDYSFRPADSATEVRIGDTLYRKIGEDRGASDSRGSIQRLGEPEPQLQYSPPGSSAQYTFFLDGQNGIAECCCIGAAGIRFDFMSADKAVLITRGTDAIGIEPDFSKRQMAFNPATRRTTTLLSLFEPAGIRLCSLAGPGLAYADMNPSWPESYKSRTIGPFTFLYTDKDADLLKRLDAKKLSSIVEDDARLCGLTGMRGRTIVIPPDLKAYSRLYASKPKTTIGWWPSGFETEDHIVMWPLSVPVYTAMEGQDYFLGQEIYEIIAHEYAHLLIGESTGILSPVPVWLNEGLAVYVETRNSPDAKNYWDTTFAVARGRHRLLDWDEATLKGTGEFPIVDARTEYAQSYALVESLIGRFGAAKIDEYVRSFRATPESLGSIDLKGTYRQKFKTVFGISFEAAVEALGMQT